MTFVEYCKDNGINLLKDDLKHIRKCLKCLHVELSEQKKIMKKYADIWLDEDKEKIGNGRKEANLFLLRMVYMQPVA